MQQGMRQVAIAELLHVGQTDVSRIWHRFLETGSLADRPGKGRRRKTTAAQDRYLNISAHRNPIDNATRLKQGLQAATGVRVSTQTVRNRLHEVGLRARRPLKATPLNRGRKGARVVWARNHSLWTRQQWGRTLFCDETRISLHPDNNDIRVWRGRAQRLHPNFIRERHYQQGGSVMFWGGIMFGRRTPLVPIQGAMTGRKYRDDILEPIVAPFAEHHAEEFTLMDDNARPHRHHVVNTFLDQHRIRRMEWPPYSPDLNCIENAWAILKRAINNRPNPPHTLQDVSQAAVEEWDNIQQEVLDRLIESMPHRVQRCLQMRGGPIGC